MSGSAMDINQVDGQGPRIGRTRINFADDGDGDCDHGWGYCGPVHAEHHAGSPCEQTCDAPHEDMYKAFRHDIKDRPNETPRHSAPIDIDIPDRNMRGMAQVHLCSVISRLRVVESLDEPTRVNATALSQIRSVLADLLDLP